MTTIENNQTSQRSPAVGGKSDNRFLWRFPLFGLSCEVILTTVGYSATRTPLIFYLYGVVAVTMLVIAIMGLAALIRGRLKRAAALLLAPFIVVAPGLFPLGPFEYQMRDRVRFYSTTGRYDAVIDKLPPAERASKVVFFEWGGSGFLDASSDYWLVYDESGEIALPDEERSQAWKDRVYPEHRLTDKRCATFASHLSGHYYSVVMHCAG